MTKLWHKLQVGTQHELFDVAQQYQQHLDPPESNPSGELHAVEY